uniref:POM121 transmembrane nucleoporin n=1 Tax=Latimeria chalumnae TaxID=7897 RepID=H3BI18_LATCH
MSPGEKRRVVLGLSAALALAFCGLVFYFLPAIVWTGVGVTACLVLYSACGTRCLGAPSRLGLQLPPALRRWIPANAANGVPAYGKASKQPRPRLRDQPGEAWQVAAERWWESPREAETAVWSPGDALMGSYLSRQDNPAKAGTRELRERLARPNHAVPTPNRRLSFGEQLSSASRFTVTSRRRYPIQQPQYSSLGALPTVRWDGYGKKTVLSARNSTMVHSPVTVKIARPDTAITRSPILEHLISPSVSSPSANSPDPCARETVLSALKESRKRGAEEEEERASTSGQENKRRRHDSSESGHSAFEPLLANGAPGSLVPKPGTLKRGNNSHCGDDLFYKRSRTSSVSSLNNAVVGGIPTFARNPIVSSYSSSRGLKQVRKRTGLNISPFSSSPSSRSQTPERPAKKQRDEELHRSNASTPVKADKVEGEQIKEKVTTSPLQRPPISSTFLSTSGGDGKRKRKIPLLANTKGEQLTLPPPPQLGYAVTVEDLDLEKKAALERINKVLESKPGKNPAAMMPNLLCLLAGGWPVALCQETWCHYDHLYINFLSTSTNFLEPVTTSVSAVVPAPSSVPSFTVNTAPLPTPVKVLESTPVTIVVCAPPSVTSAIANPNPLLESLKKMQSTTDSGIATASTGLFPVESVVGATASLGTPKSTESSGTPPALASNPNKTLTDSSIIRPIPTLNPTLSSILQSSAPSSSQPTGTTGLLFTPTASSSQNQPVRKGPDATATVASTGGIAFGLVAPSKPSLTTEAGTPSVASSTTAAPSAFKPIFSAVLTGQSNMQAPAETTSAPVTTLANSTVPSSTSTMFKPIFGNLVAPTATTTKASSLFTFGQTSQPPTAASTTAPTTFQLGTIATTASCSATTFQFGNPASTSAPQLVSIFGQSASTAPKTLTGTAAATSTETTSAFGAFSKTTSAATTASASQPAFSFGSSVGPSAFSTNPNQFGTATSQTGFGSGTVNTQQEPLTFGTTSQPAFGGATTQPAFGTTSASFSFGTATSSTKPSLFGSGTQTSNSNPSGSAFGTANPTFNFGASNQPSTATATFGIGGTAQNSSTGGFNFAAAQSGSAGIATPFGASAGASNQSTQFAFGATNTTENKPAFGGTSTPVFGQSTPGAAGNLSFGTPGTPAPNFGASPFGASTPAFSIGSGSKPMGARQRLQARRQHHARK